MNKSLASKSTARRKAFSKHWCLQRKKETVKKKDNTLNMKAKQSSI